jgi:hypothetical protein
MNADADHDGVYNFGEYAFGLDPKDGASARPVISPPTPASGTLTYNRRRQSLTGLDYSVWYSDDLNSWTRDTGAVESTSTVNGEVETVSVTLSNGLLAGQRLFIQIRAD